MTAAALVPGRTRHELQEQIRHSLARVTRSRSAAHDWPQRSVRRRALRTWQSARLAHTHQDLLHDPRYAAAAQFFLSDLYGPADTSERDAQLARAIPKLAALLPLNALQALALALELDALTEELDSRMLDALQGRQGAQAALRIDAAAYAEAYRASGTRAQRQAQVELVDAIGHLLDRVAHKPMVTVALELSRGPARLAGLGAVQDFLERGLAAFRGMQAATAFLESVRQREAALMERLFAGGPAPFALAVEA